jgi:hypothetical protein
LIGASKPNLSESEKSEVSKHGYKHVLETTGGVTWDCRNMIAFKAVRNVKKLKKK